MKSRSLVYRQSSVDTLRSLFVFSPSGLSSARTLPWTPPPISLPMVYSGVSFKPSLALKSLGTLMTCKLFNFRSLARDCPALRIATKLAAYRGINGLSYVDGPFLAYRVFWQRWFVRAQSFLRLIQKVLDSLGKVLCAASGFVTTSNILVRARSS